MVTGRIDWWGAAVLAAAIGVTLSRYVCKRAGVFRPLVLQLAPWLVGATAGIALSVSLGAMADQRRSLARLVDRPSDTPNVLLIVLDTQRAANTSLYGSARRTTPGLERLAESSVVFDRAIATTPWTLPSHASMFTGRLNRELGTGFARPLDSRYPTLAEALVSSGYTTAGFVSNLIFTTDFYGLDRGFLRYEDQPRSPGMTLASSWLTRHAIRTLRSWVGNRQDLVRKRAEDVNRRFLNWLEAEDYRPFFVFLNYYDAHDPYLPPAPFDTLYREIGGRYHIERDQDSGLYTTSELEELEAAYDAGIAYQDHHVGLLLDSLESRGIMEETLVLVTSDHGESFGEHGWVAHANSVHLTEVHVPLLIRPPGGLSTGRRVEAAVSLRDLPATVLGVLGLDQGPFPGHSLGAYLTQDAGVTDPPSSPAVSELRGQWSSLIDGAYHYLRGPDGEEELYDIGLDPLEEHDLSGDPRRLEVLQRFKDELATQIGGGAGSSSE
jgi:arylsulfatase A-like enzyme